MTDIAKCCRVIDSCKTQEQLEVAKRYIQRFMKIRRQAFSMLIQAEIESLLQPLEISFNYLIKTQSIKIDFPIGKNYEQT